MLALVDPWSILFIKRKDTRDITSTIVHSSPVVSERNTITKDLYNLYTRSALFPALRGKICLRDIVASAGPGDRRAHAQGGEHQRTVLHRREREDEGDITVGTEGNRGDRPGLLGYGQTGSFGRPRVRPPAMFRRCPAIVNSRFMDRLYPRFRPVGTALPAPREQHDADGPDGSGKGAVFPEV